MKKKAPTTRAEARELIVQRANIFKINAHRRRWRWRAGPMTFPVLLSMRQLQQAVCVCRRNDLVEDQVLELAGFRSRRPTIVHVAVDGDDSNSGKGWDAAKATVAAAVSALRQGSSGHPTGVVKIGPGSYSAPAGADAA